MIDPITIIMGCCLAGVAIALMPDGGRNRLARTVISMICVAGGALIAVAGFFSGGWQ